MTLGDLCLCFCTGSVIFNLSCAKPFFISSYNLGSCPHSQQLCTKACASLLWADSFPAVEFCSFLFIVCQAYFSFCRVLWLSHLVQCVHLPRWSLPNIKNLITVQDLQGVRCKMEFYQIELNGSDWKCWHDRDWHLHNSMLCWTPFIFMVSQECILHLLFESLLCLWVMEDRLLQKEPGKLDFLLLGIQ